ncbi:DEAD/DEAH box helicase [Telmatospirillum sp. J64-1]|uniref:DEAD/DEAH box helicase n=1 Tax=Telmatospirillum sp. J64-1 TaxID=2502183 RepID=UPI00115CCEBD|nr:DEAD/DEAH box helicase [Telmatospirillum sp. J64-1]
MNFSELGLGAELLKAIEEVGYTTPTPIQSQAIPVILMGRDVLGVAQTGTGKTASFTLPMIEILASGRAKARMPRSLILAPTRELAAQVAENFELYGKYHRLSMALLIGGESFSDQERALDRGVDVLIATPGRLIDLFERGRILLNDVKILVIDEADRMLDMGFIPDVERIVSLLPSIRQTLFFSATMAPEIKRLADAFLMNPKEISVAPPSSTAATVSQHLLVVDEMDKREALRQLLRHEDVKNALIFCNRKRDVEIVYKSLTKHGFSVVRLHGDMPQSSRTETLELFKKGEASMMVCSDVAARGIDISALSHVFNFDVPIHSEDYVHRIGRTGRAGREGRAYTIATPDDGRFVAAIEKLIGKPIPRVELEGMPQLELDMEGGARKRRGKKGKDSRSESRRPERTEQRAAPAEAPAQPERREPERREERRDFDRNRSRDQRPAQGQQNGQSAPQGRDRRDRRRREYDEFGIGEMKHPDNVLGFGEHVPDFIKIEIVLPPVRSAEEYDELDEVELEQPEEAVTEQEETPAEKPERTRRPRRQRRRAEEKAAEETAAEEPAVQEEAAEESVSAEPAATEEPVLVEEPATVAEAAPVEAVEAEKAAEAAPAEETPSVTEAPAAEAVEPQPTEEAAPEKPKRTRRKAAPKEQPAEGEEQKPVRKRAAPKKAAAKKTDENADEKAVSEKKTAAKKPAAKKATTPRRRKKAEEGTEAATPADATPVEAAEAAAATTEAPSTEE